MREILDRTTPGKPRPTKDFFLESTMAIGGRHEHALAIQSERCTATKIMWADTSPVRSLHLYSMSHFRWESSPPRFTHTIQYIGHSSHVGRLFDFAGLFPPAGQSMPEAIATFARHQQEPFAWMLNRFVLPANRIQEFVDGVKAWQAASSPSKQAVRWPLSILSTNWSTDEAAVRQTIASAPALAASMEIESVEQKSMMAEPSTLPIYVELPVDANLEQNLEQVKKSGGLAKLRSGGLTPAEFPSSSSVVRFLSGVQTQQMGMKAQRAFTIHLGDASGLSKTRCLVCPMHGFVPFILRLAFWNGPLRTSSWLVKSSKTKTRVTLPSTKHKSTIEIKSSKSRRWRRSAATASMRSALAPLKNQSPIFWSSDG